MSTEENKALVRRFIEEAWNKGNIDAADQFVASDFVDLDPLPGQQQGLEGLKQALAMMRTAFPDIHFTIEEQVAEGDKVVSRFTWRGTHRGEFFGVPPTSKQVAVPGIVIDRIVEGKALEGRALMNLLSMLTQLGVISSPGQGSSSLL